MEKNKTLITFIQNYKRGKKENPDQHIAFCLSKIGNTKEIVKNAALSLNFKRKIHSHQYRVGKKKLKAFAENLTVYSRQIENAKSFDEIMKIVSKNRTYGIGELTVYDTSLRIGNCLGKMPDRVYLHAGTREGAKKILRELPRNKYLLKSELPAPFQRKDLSEDEIEDILCHFNSGKKKIEFC